LVEVAITVAALFVLATVFVPFVYFLQFLYYRLILPIMIISLILRIISPILGVAGYRCIRPETKSTAAGLLIAAGAITFLTVGGIILIMAGALVASWEPEEYYTPSLVRVKPEDWKMGEPRAAPRLGEDAGGIREGRCTYCGARLWGDEKYCPSCGQSLKTL